MLENRAKMETQSRSAIPNPESDHDPLGFERDSIGRLSRPSVSANPRFFTNTYPEQSSRPYSRDLQITSMGGYCANTYPKQLLNIGT